MEVYHNMDKTKVILKFLLLEIENLESILEFAEKRRKKHLMVNELCKLEHYTNIYNYIINLQ